MSCITSYGQNKRVYAIDPQLKFLSNFNPPVSKAIVPVASVFMDLIPKKIDKENIIYESFKVGDVKMHIMTPRSKADEITPCMFYIYGGGFIFKAYTNHPSIGIILCRRANRAFVEYAIRDYTKPMGVATYKTLGDMPEAFREALPDEDNLKKLL